VPAGLAIVLMAATLLGCTSADDADHGGGHVATVSGGADEGPYAGREISDPKPRPDFVLTDQDGTSFDFAEETAGQPTLLFFGYANCPDVCPTTMADVALALKAVPADLAARTQVVFVTTDPARDTAEFLGSYLAQFDQGLPNRFIGLTGSQGEVEMAQSLAGVPLAESGGEMHSTSLFLYGADDVARVMFSAGDSQAEIAEDLETIAAG
jgi:protein SCO1/2